MQPQPDTRHAFHQLVIDHKLPSVPNIHWNSAPFRLNTCTQVFGRVSVSGAASARQTPLRAHPYSHSLSVSI